MSILLKLDDGVKLPEYKTKGSAGADVVAHKIITAYKGEVEVNQKKLDKMREGFEQRGTINLRPFERILFGTGLTVAFMEEYWEIQVRPRSGLSLKKGVIITNSPGTIDSKN